MGYFEEFLRLGWGLITEYQNNENGVKSFTGISLYGLLNVHHVTGAVPKTLPTLF